MSNYLALARKYRPQKFDDVLGQSNVLTAIKNSLDRNRLHHAYLLTGTRGVGKTTIARLFAKALNCEKGVSSTPCGCCEACKAIENGNFLDLIEIDAASRTKVEDTRSILENVSYKPTVGRYKVYIIDEVHMLSKASFNALLKTLEEPPEYVKFILATTDPQNIPVTIVSRCLQFKLRNLTNAQIVQNLTNIFNIENITSDARAIQIIAEVANGSMRDALSIADQAIALTNANIKAENLINMLGVIDSELYKNTLQAIYNKDANQLYVLIEQIDSFSPNYESILNALANLIHEITMFQALGENINMGFKTSIETLRFFAKSINPELLQIYYQIILIGKKELYYAPNGRVAFDMTLLRMLSFASPNGAPVVQNYGVGVSPNNLGTNNPNALAQSNNQAFNAQNRVNNAPINTISNQTPFPPSKPVATQFVPNINSAGGDVSLDPSLIDALNSVGAMISKNNLQGNNNSTQQNTPLPQATSNIPNQPKGEMDPALAAELNNIQKLIKTHGTVDLPWDNSIKTIKLPEADQPLEISPFQSKLDLSQGSLGVYIFDQAQNRYVPMGSSNNMTKPSNPSVEDYIPDQEPPLDLASIEVDALDPNVQGTQAPIVNVESNKSTKIDNVASTTQQQEPNKKEETNTQAQEPIVVEQEKTNQDLDQSSIAGEQLNPPSVQAANIVKVQNEEQAIEANNTNPTAVVQSTSNETTVDAYEDDENGDNIVYDVGTVPDDLDEDDPEEEYKTANFNLVYRGGNDLHNSQNIAMPTLEDLINPYAKHELIQKGSEAKRMITYTGELPFEDPNEYLVERAYEYVDDYWWTLMRDHIKDEFIIMILKSTYLEKTDTEFKIHITKQNMLMISDSIKKQIIDFLAPYEPLAKKLTLVEDPECMAKSPTALANAKYQSIKRKMIRSLDQNSKFTKFVKYFGLNLDSDNLHLIKPKN